MEEKKFEIYKLGEDDQYHYESDDISYSAAKRRVNSMLTEAKNSGEDLELIIVEEGKELTEEPLATGCCYGGKVTKIKE